MHQCLYSDQRSGYMVKPAFLLSKEKPQKHQSSGYVNNDEDMYEKCKLVIHCWRLSQIL